jgi:hypothetical protein
VSTKSILVQGGDGTAIPSGFNGYIATSTDTSQRLQNTPASGTLYYVAGMPSLTLGVGSWLIFASATLYYSVSGSAGTANAGLHIRDTTAGNTLGVAKGGVSGASNSLYTEGLSTFGVLRVTSGTSTVQMQMSLTTFSGSPTLDTIQARGDLATSQLYALFLG